MRGGHQVCGWHFMAATSPVVRKLDQETKMCVVPIIEEEQGSFHLYLRTMMLLGYLCEGIIIFLYYSLSTAQCFRVEHPVGQMYI